jgi:hypothetical protein
MENMKRIATAAALAAATVVAWPITLGQIDTFEDGTTMNWTGGVPAPVNVTTGGPQGVDDNYVRIVAGAGANIHLAMRNDVQWSGDWLAEGVTVVECHLRNEGEVPLEMRLVLISSGTRLTSTNAVMLPADGKWHKSAFPVRPGDLTRVLGSLEYGVVMASVTTMLIRHDAGAPSSGGEPVEGTCGIDNIEASVKADVQPESYVKVRGNEMGPLENLFFSDNIRMDWRPGVTLSTAQAPAVMQVTGHAPFTNPSALSISIEVSGPTAVQQTIALRNRTTGQYIQVNQQTLTPAEQTITINVPNFADYIDPTTGEMRAQFSYRQLGPTLSFPWIVRQDRIFWRLST